MNEPASQVPEVPAATKLTGAWLVLENATQFLYTVWIFLWTLEDGADEKTKENIRKMRLEILKEIEFVKSERGLFHADAPTTTAFH